MANILIADDSIIMRKNLKSIITRAGHSVAAEAVNGQQAYLLYNKDEIDLVTLDITMPVMDGIEALKKILEKDQDAKVIIISALDQKKMVFQALECGAKYYIIKPVTEEKIVNAFNKILNIHQPYSHSIEPINSSESGHGLKKATDSTNNFTIIDKSEPLPPFNIDNINGIFMININNTIDTANISTLETAMQGLLFIKPLKIIFNICDSLLQKEIYDILAKIAKSIKSVGGELEIKGNTLPKELKDI